MQPWTISTGLTATIAGAVLLLSGARLDYLGPFWPAVLADHGVALALHSAFAILSLAAAIDAVARATALSDFGRRVDLAERSVRRGEADAHLNDALNRDAEGDRE